MLQVYMRWKALVEIYLMHFFAPFWKLNFCLKIAKMFASVLPNIAKFGRVSLELIDFRADFFSEFHEILENQ